jgi:hypothetical protein
MYNEEIYQKLLKEFGENKMVTVTDVISIFYDIKYSSTNNLNLSDEFDYERNWWKEKHIELIKQKEVNL